MDRYVFTKEPAVVNYIGDDGRDQQQAFVTNEDGHVEVEGNTMFFVNKSDGRRVELIDQPAQWIAGGLMTKEGK